MDRRLRVAGTEEPRNRPVARGTAAYPRRRGNTAYQVCRARRTKCDGGTPCDFCLRTGATCIRSATDLSSFDPASIQIIDRIECLTREFQELRNSLSNQTQFTIHKPNSTPTTTGLAPSDTTWVLPPSAEDVLPSDHTNLHLLTILKSSIGSTPGALSVGSPVSSFADFDPQSINMLMERFFDHVHVKNPVLDEHATRQLVSRFVLHGIDWSAPSCLVLLVCALGALATPLGPSHGIAPGSTSYSSSYSYFVAAQKRLGVCLMEGGLIQAQCLFLAGVYLMTIFRPLEAWRMFSQSLACCQDFAFLTDSNTAELGISNAAWSNSMVSEQAVYWSAWKSEKETRTDLRPPDFTIQDLRQVEFPKFFPTPPAPVDTDTERQARAWTFYLTEISLRRHHLMLITAIIETTKQPRMAAIRGSMETLPDRMAQVDEWLTNIPPTMSLKTPPHEDEICKFVLRGHILNLYEMLHWPYLSYFIDSGGNYEANVDSHIVFSGTECTRLKALAETALEYHADRIRVNQPGFLHRHHGTWFLIRACSRSATMLLKAVLHNQQCSDEERSLGLPHDWQTVVGYVIELHQFWKAEVPDAAFRLGALESLLAQVDHGLAS